MFFSHYSHHRLAEQSGVIKMIHKEYMWIDDTNTIHRDVCGVKGAIIEIVTEKRLVSDKVMTICPHCFDERMIDMLIEYRKDILHDNQD